MKNSKKIVALVLAMVMIFALTASAFAATNNTMTVYVTVQRVDPAPTEADPNATVTTPLCTEVTFDVSSNATVFDLVNELSESGFAHAHNPAWRDVVILDENNQPTTQKGKVLCSLSNTTISEVMGNTITTEKVWGGVSENSIMVNSDLFGTSKHGEYEGTEWAYSVNGVEPDVYMNQCTLQAGDKVVLSYKYSKFEWNQYIPNGSN